MNYRNTLAVNCVIITIIIIIIIIMIRMTSFKSTHLTPDVGLSSGWLMFPRQSWLWAAAGAAGL